MRNYMHTKIEKGCYTLSLFGASLTPFTIKIEKPIPPITNEGNLLLRNYTPTINDMFIPIATNFFY